MTTTSENLGFREYQTELNKNQQPFHRSLSRTDRVRR